MPHLQYVFCSLLNQFPTNINKHDSTSKFRGSFLKCSAILSKRSLHSLLEFPCSSHLISKSFLTILAIIFTLILVPRCFAAQITVAWDQNFGTEIAGYKMYYGTSSGDYEYSVDVGNTTNCSISGLTEGSTYYLAATAYNTNNVESNFSEELVHTVESPITNNPPTATIDSITPNPADVGDLVSFTGHGDDSDGSVISYEWVSSIDGLLNDTDASFTTTTLSQGTHKITFRVFDDNGAASDWVKHPDLIIQGVTTNNPPTVSITSPAIGASFDSGAIISFDGAASDNEDGDLTGGMVWSSDLQGQIATGGSFTALLSDGTHKITAEVTDSGGSTASGSTAITVGGGSEGRLTLNVNAFKIKGDKYAELTWSGANSDNVVVYRDGGSLITKANDGAFTHGPFSKGKPATYQVCEAGTSTCSKTVSVSW